MDLIPKHIEEWLDIIENMSYDNTYKLAWGRAILECVNHKQYNIDSEVNISFNDIADKFIKYYWNQLFFFNLKQTHYIDKEPIICHEVRKLIDKYKEVKASELPVWFDKGMELLSLNNNDLLTSVKKKVISTLHQDVCYRFKNVPNKTLEIYKYEKKCPYISFNSNDIISLEKYNIVLAELLNFKWAQLLEDYNHQPKIVSKVKGISNSSIKRNSLTKYKTILLNQFKNGEVYDFYTNECIDINDISIDHVIPWSFMYSDDIWNLVITTKSNNSSKSNSVPTEEVINKLKIRNNELLVIVEESVKKDIQYAIDNNLVDKYYYDFRV